MIEGLVGVARASRYSCGNARRRLTRIRLLRSQESRTAGSRLSLLGWSVLTSASLCSDFKVERGGEGNEGDRSLSTRLHAAVMGYQGKRGMVARGELIGVGGAGGDRRGCWPHGRTLRLRCWALGGAAPLARGRARRGIRNRARSGEGMRKRYVEGIGERILLCL
jgi:hypothetical protein